MLGMRNPASDPWRLALLSVLGGGRIRVPDTARVLGDRGGQRLKARSRRLAVQASS